MIELESGVQYQRVRDGHDPSAGYAAGNHQELTSVENSRNTATASLKVELLVKETLEELLVSFRFSSSKGIFNLIGPGWLSQVLIKGIGRVYCPQSACKLLPPPYRVMVTVDGGGEINAEDDFCAGRFVVIRQLSGNVLARCLGTFTSSYHKPLLDGGRAHFLLRLDECLSCCIRAAASSVDDLVYIVT